MTRLFEEMTPPATEPEAYILIVSYTGHSGESVLLEDLLQNAPRRADNVGKPGERENRTRVILKVGVNRGRGHAVF
jgi:hypothetical protein